MSSATITILANGKPRALPAGSTIGDLVSSLGVEPAQVLVERNGEPVEREAYPDTTLADGDALELAQMVGGG